MLDAERRAREAKTARLKAQRQFLEASAARLPPDPVSKEPQPPRRQKRVRKMIEVS
ncbi:hypothetical protein [Mesorhizobium neociceri]|uniref:Uncharacterized protein n=1 Tax=Mesorhizobium neociceri TaxID=1307853 RepID=A0A838BEL9_9HYPH|nr:hypothetical protein [Mesorhizobium neociceri]MBA1144762.1 hypothetical protein [Mesorhizobium neociceri]